MARESALWGWLSKLKQQVKGPRNNLQAERIENAVGSDYPDVEGCYNGCQFHWELKSVKRPAREGTPIRIPHLTDGQVRWHKKRHDCGGNSYFLVQVGSGHRRMIYLLPGLFGEKMQEGQTEEWYQRMSRVKSLECPSQKDLLFSSMRRQ